MTIVKGYNVGMELLSVQGLGAFLTFCIFLICVIIVHITKLAFLGWQAHKKKERKPKEKPPKPAKPAEPVYYIVEKKKKVAPQYEKPKKIKFQK